MSRWDALRSRTKGDHGATAPRCSRCGEIRVLNPCRDCATAAELHAYPPAPDGPVNARRTA